MEEALSDIWNTCFNLEQRQLISMSLHFGGLNILLASRSVLSVIVGSVSQSVNLQHRLMHITPLDGPSNWASLALNSWNVII